MPKKEKNKGKESLVFKEFSFLMTVLLWGILIFFKPQIPPLLQVILFIALIIMTIFSVISVNKAFFRVKK